jgi:pimeloyl-ACP methyl ester carboxylesterase
MSSLTARMVLVDQVAVILPGAGSSAEFVARAFGRALHTAGYGLVAPDPVPGPGLVTSAFRSLDECLDRYGDRLRLVGGVSLGAHVAARWAVDRAGLAGLLLAMPAWTGAPGPVAAATAASAGVVDRLGTAGALAAAGTAVPWVAAELALAWPRYGPALGASLRAAAGAAGPTIAELAGIRAPAGLVACADDPLHPYGVAAQWAAALPQAVLRRLELADLAEDRALLGSTALDALTAARTSR